MRSKGPPPLVLAQASGGGFSKALRGQTDPEESPEMPFQHVKTKRRKGERSELFGCERSVASCIFGFDSYAWAHMNLNTWGDGAHPSQESMCPHQNTEAVCQMLLLYTLVAGLEKRQKDKMTWKKGTSNLKTPSS